MLTFSKFRQMINEEITSGSFGGFRTPDVKTLARVSNKFVYHSGTSDKVKDMKWGLEPQHGDWVKEVAAGATDDPEEMLDKSTPLVWMSDHPNWVHSKVARKLGKHVTEVTEDDIRQHGHVALIPKKGDHAAHIWRVHDEGLSNGPYSDVTNLRGEKKKAFETDLYDDNKEPFGVERNEYISAQPIEPMFHLTGQHLVDFMKHTGHLGFQRKSRFV